jgi:Flp pilus assembly protein TadD
MRARVAHPGAAPGGAAGSAELSPESHLIASHLSFQDGRFEDSLREAREALKQRPSYAEAHNNVAAACASLGRWDEAVAAAREALRLRPDFPLARNNLAWAVAHLQDVPTAAAKGKMPRN